MEQRVSPSVTDGETLKVQVGILLFVNVGGDGGDIVAGIRFSSNVQRSTFEFGIGFHEFGHEKIEVFCDFCLIFDIVGDFGLGKAGAYGLIHIEHVGVIVPRVFVFLERQIIIDLVRSVLEENGEFGGTARTTS